MVSTCRWPIRPRPRRYIEIIVTMTTETAIERLRRRPLPTSPRRNWNRMSCLAPSRAQRSLVWTVLCLRKIPPLARGASASRPLGGTSRRRRLLVEPHARDGARGVVPRLHVADEHPAVEPDDALAHGVDGDGVVGGHDDRRARAVDAVEQLDDAEAGVGVQVARGLVGEQDRRPVDEGPGDGNTLLLTTGELVRQALLHARESDELERLGHGLADAGAAAAEDLQGVGDVLKDRLVGQQAEVLEDAADLAAQGRDLALRQAVEVATGDEDAAPRDVLLLHDELHHRGLARTGRAHDEGELAPRDLEIDVVERRTRGPRIGLRDVLEEDHGSCLDSYWAGHQRNGGWAGRARAGIRRQACTEPHTRLRADERIPRESNPPGVAGREWGCGGTDSVLLAVLADLPADPRLDETVDVAVEDSARVARLVLGAEVLDHLVRVEDVGAHLVTPARLDVARHLLLHCGLLRLALQEQSRLEDPQRGSAVLDLALLVLHRYDDAGRQVSHADRRVGRIDAVATGSARAEDVDLQLVLGDVDGVVALDERDDLDGGEARLAT